MREQKAAGACGVSPSAACAPRAHPRRPTPLRAYVAACERSSLALGHDRYTPSFAKARLAALTAAASLPASALRCCGCTQTGNTALHRAARSGGLACVTLLVERGANIHATNEVRCDAPLSMRLRAGWLARLRLRAQCCRKGAQARKMGREHHGAWTFSLPPDWLRTPTTRVANCRAHSAARLQARCPTSVSGSLPRCV